jgi:UDP-N-acetylmuramate dehydrogenase
MSWWSKFADRIERDAPIGRCTWFRLGGNARFLCHPRDAKDLSALMRCARDHGVPCKALGSGANVLVSDDGYDGVVIRLDNETFRRVDRHDDSVTLGAGVDLMPLAKQCSEEGLSGLECMAGIPATVGGAVRMNAGGRFGSFGDVVRRVTCVGSDGIVETIDQSELGFGYRRSLVGDRIVCSVEIGLCQGDPVQVKRRFDEYFSYKQETQPLADKSAGCVFKNPPGQSAGALIDRAGLKGARCGAAHVSHRHANFIIADPGATATDVMELIDLVRDRVEREFGTRLEIEIDIWRPEMAKACI